MEEFSHKTTPDAKAPWVKPLIYVQIAVQTAMALSPFWLTTAHASADSHTMNNTASKLSMLGEAAQSKNLQALPAQQATGVASQQLEQWLQNFGTARVELNTDSKFAVNAGAIDLLLPLSQNQQHLFFSQNGLRQIDDQLTGNIGFGMRHFLNEWMLGYNGFYDQNISRGHKRLGTGVEAWRDYVKLSTNGYWRVSDWRSSVDVEDYDARPANGFDVRAEGWLPAYPALGGRLMYEKYYGDEVALISKDKRQRNPNAVTAGLSWTPVPLISFTTDHKKSSNLSETTFGVQFAWQFGQSLASQLDAASVANRRTLAGSGMDLVERNNNIVLEYRKHQLVELALPKEITGESGKNVPIAVQVQAKYGVAKIIWNDASLITAGGKIVDQGNNNYQLTLPKYSAGSANRYTLSGVAYDSRNNASKTATTTIIVNAPAFSLEKSTLVSSDQSILADGKATTTIMLRLVDENDQAITGLGDALKANLEENQLAASSPRISTLSIPAPAKPATLSAITEQPDGSYTMVLTAGTRPAEVKISTLLDGVALPSIVVQQISDAATARVREGDVIALQGNAVANGLAENQVRARITDATGNPVAGVSVTFSLSGSAQVATGASLTMVSDKQGYSLLKFTNRVAETVTVGVKTANGSSAQLDTQFKADSENPDAGASTLSSTISSLIADGQSAATLTLSLKDSAGNVISGQTVEFLSSLSGSAIDSVIDHDDGRYSASMTSTKSGNATITVKVNGRIFAVAPVNMTFTADSNNIDASQSTLGASVSTIVANGSTASTLTLQLKDRNANPVSGQLVTFASSLANSNISSVIDHGDGSYSASFTGSKAGVATITAQLGGAALAVKSINVSLIADISTARIASNDFTVDNDRALANNTEMVTYTATVKDALGNTLENQLINWSVDLEGATLNSTSSMTDAAGQADVMLKSERWGFATVTATLKNGSNISNNKVRFTKLVIKTGNEVELTATEIAAVLQNTKEIDIQIYAGSKVQKITLPAAASFSGKKIDIFHRISQNVDLVINGNTIVLTQDDTLRYVSDGTNWTK